MKNPLVSVIIVNWNGKRFLKDCLNSLLKTTYKNIEIVLVDNASTDSSVEYIKRSFPLVKIIKNRTNLGVSAGHDIGFKNTRGEAILLLNSDTIIEDNVVGKLVKSLYADKNIGAVQPKLVIYPGEHLIDSVGCFFLANGDLYHYGREKDPNDPKYNKTMEIFSTKGACMLIRREVLERTGLFDRDFYAYFEDTDLCIRIWLSGYKIIYIPSATVYHKGGGGAKQMMHSYILYHSYKNRIYTYLKNFSFKYIIKTIPLTFLLYQVAFFGYLFTGKVNCAAAVQRAIFWNIFNIKNILRKRQYVQDKIRVIKDDDFIPRLTKRVHLSYYYYQFFGGIDKYND